MALLKPRLLRFGAIIALAAILTVLTQIGGVVLLLSWLLGRTILPEKRRLALQALLFISLYVACTWWVIPPLAARAGRTALRCRASSGQPYAAALKLYCALNRNYVDPRLAAMLTALARDIDRTYPGTTTLYLDANFPFLDGFPMTPHLSHDDGLKLDLAFFYTSPDGKYVPYQLRSPIGYGGFEERRPDEVRPPCPAPLVEHHWKLAFDPPPDIALDIQRTGAALRWLATKGPTYGVEKIFIEPYLAERLGVSSPVVGFQGCHAARHDDHIHVQMRKSGDSLRIRE